MNILKPTKFKLPIANQLNKIIDELNEAVEAYMDYEDAEKNLNNLKAEIAKEHMLEELCDVQVAVETLKVHNYRDLEIKKMEEFVNKKNKQRGYLK